MTQKALQTASLTKKFGDLTAVSDVSLSFDEDAACAIIGPNGAGKTTFFNLLTGSLLPTDGTIRFQGEDITNFSANETANEGLIRTFQVTTLFSELTVRRNIEIALQSDNPYNFWSDAREKSDKQQRVQELLERVDLYDKADEPAATLSHGGQRGLMIAIALATDPEMLLLDEPTSGVSPQETEEFGTLISDIATDIPILIIEHKMSVVSKIADRIVVLDQGAVIADGAPSEVRDNETVQKAYLQGVHQ